MQKSTGVDVSIVTGTLNNLGGVFFDQEKYTQAEPLLKQSLEIQKNTWERSTHP
jgi:hypothetical protein